MLNPNPAIKEALIGDSALTAKIGSGSVYQTYPSIKTLPPFVIFREINNKPAFGADDAEYAAEITITIDGVASDKTLLEAILVDVDRIMVSIGYYRDRLGPVLTSSGNFVREIRFKTEKEV